MFRKLLHSFFSGSPRHDSDEWTLLLESAEAEEVAVLIDFLDERDVEYFLEKDNRPVWEPYPRSTERLYVRREELDQVKDELAGTWDSEVLGGPESER